MKVSRAPQGARGLKSAITSGMTLPVRSRPARGAWVEIRSDLSSVFPFASRPARGAWVEIPIAQIYCAYTLSRRAPQGARGLKYLFPASPVAHDARRAPQGARGLKFPYHPALCRVEIRRAPQGARGLKYIGRRSSSAVFCVAPRKRRVG